MSGTGGAGPHLQHPHKAYLTTKEARKQPQNKDGLNISVALTDLSSQLLDGEPFICYFKEAEKIITTVSPHLM